ncbi:MAG: class I SAM-dependent methyltransferase [Bryobacterales bacterium]|nr:class I SAM-dependent methyltransferase [Bryobacterales bacterium]
MENPAPEALTYEQQLENERNEFSLKEYDPTTLLENISTALTYSFDAFGEKVRRTLGLGPWEYIVAQVNSRPAASVLSLGSGPCGVELELAKSFIGPYQLTCLDLNEKLLATGAEKARALGIEIRTMAQDANFLSLNETYDVVLAHAALHHFMNFEHLLPEIHDHLSPDGVFIAHEPVPRNGMLLWPRTRELVDGIFRVLPARYRRKGRMGAVIETYPDVEYTQGAFECIRSEELVGLLERHFCVEARVLGHAFTRRFVDGGFGDNYDLTREEDRVIIDLLLTFDEFLTENKFLLPENVFMVLRRKDSTPQSTASGVVWPQLLPNAP